MYQVCRYNTKLVSSYFHNLLIRPVASSGAYDLENRLCHIWGTGVLISWLSTSAGQNVLKNIPHARKMTQTAAAIVSSPNKAQQQSKTRIDLF